MKKKLIIGIVIILILIFLLKGNITGNTVKSEEVIKLPLADINEQANFYEYQSNGKTIKYFAVKASDGSIKTAFDACDVCYSAKKGYRQEGDYMICNNCGNKYAIDSLGTENIKGGGCWPGYLPNTLEDNYITIKKSDLDKGKYRF